MINMFHFKNESLFNYTTEMEIIHHHATIWWATQLITWLLFAGDCGYDNIFIQLWTLYHAHLTENLKFWRGFNELKGFYANKWCLFVNHRFGFHVTVKWHRMLGNARILRPTSLTCIRNLSNIRFRKMHFGQFHFHTAVLQVSAQFVHLRYRMGKLYYYLVWNKNLFILKIICKIFTFIPDSQAVGVTVGTWNPNIPHVQIIKIVSST